MENAHRCPKCRQSLAGALYRPSLAVEAQAEYLLAAAAATRAENREAQELPQQMPALPSQDTAAFTEDHTLLYQQMIQEAEARPRRGAAPEPPARDGAQG
jgi:hypothetical protein